MILLRMAACLPAAWRTPVASYMTMLENTKLTSNRGEVKPSVSPTVVVTAITNAVCELGMPPVPTTTAAQRPKGG